MEGPNANNMRVTNCLRIALILISVRNLSGNKLAKIIKRATSTSATG
jgi:hypothetical protein